MPVRREVLEHVREFAVRPLPPSGVLSRSRLRSWLFARGGTEKDWAPFVGELVKRELWRPWHGRDVESVERETGQVGYRMAATTARDANVWPVAWRQLGISSIVLAFSVLLALKLSMTCAAFLALPAMYFVVTRSLKGLMRDRVEITSGTVRIRRGRRAVEIPVRDIEWVDVITCEDRLIEDGVANPFRRLWIDHKFMVVGRTVDGDHRLLGDRLTEVAAISLCRSVESAMMEADDLRHANRTGIRVEAPDFDDVTPIVATDGSEERQTSWP